MSAAGRLNVLLSLTRYEHEGRPVWRPRHPRAVVLVAGLITIVLWIAIGSAVINVVR